MKRGKYSLAVLFIFVVAQFIFITPIAHATGGLLAVPTSTKSASATRTDQNTLHIVDTVLFQEQGVVTDSICTATVDYTLTPANGAADRWSFGSITYSNPTPDPRNGGSCATNNSGNLVVKNKANQIVGTVESSASNNLFGVVVQNSGSTYNAYLKINFGTSQENDATYGYAQYQNDLGYIPIVTLEVGRTGNPIAAIQNYTDPSGGTGGLTNKSTYQTWFTSVTSVSIKIDSSNSPVLPPYINTPADSGSGRPEIKFVLSQVDLEGNTVTNTHKWLFFQANQVNGSSLTAISDLYFVTDDDANNNYFVYAAGIAVRDIVACNGNGLNANTLTPSTQCPYVLIPPGSLSVADADVIAVFDRLMDAPKTSFDDCSSGVYTTGPSGTDGATVSAIGSSKGLTIKNASELNVNCYDKSSSGWPSLWNVKLTDVTGANGFLGNCTLGGIFGASTQGLGAIIAAAATCLYKDVFSPAVDWAAGWVSKAAGISYLLPEDRNKYVSLIRTKNNWLHEQIS